jgi:SAM-dependent methyltransferase
MKNEGSMIFEGFDDLVLSEAMGIYNSSIVGKIHDALGSSDGGGIVDFGAGIGTLAEKFREIYGILPICIEVDERQKEIIREKNFTVFDSLDELTAPATNIYSSNVLEHIDDDVGILRMFHEKLKPGGTVCIYVPALPHLYSKFDRRVGHVRRYRMNELKEKLTGAGFRIVKAEYCDCIGYLAALLFKASGKSASPSAAFLKMYDKLFAVSRWLDALGMKHVIGKNIFLAGRKV